LPWRPGLADITEERIMTAIAATADRVGARGILCRVLAALGLLVSAPLTAQERSDTIAASNPPGIVIAMLNAGFNPELTTDRTGDPMIVARGSHATLYVLFFGCNSSTHDNCQSIRLQVAFDRAKPWTPAEALNLANELAFLSVRLDAEGDPFLHWDLVLGEGIPLSVFIQNLRAFEESITIAADLIHAEEKAALLQQQKQER
jgi:hypothetical protein